jgi:hypothetical protein
MDTHSYQVRIRRKGQALNYVGALFLLKGNPPDNLGRKKLLRQAVQGFPLVQALRSVAVGLALTPANRQPQLKEAQLPSRGVPFPMFFSSSSPCM